MEGLKLINCEDLEYPWFGISHGIDNYEEVIRLDKIIYWRTGYYLDSSKEWHCKITIFFEGDIEFETSLTEKGYEKFLKCVSTKPSKLEADHG